MLTISQLDEMGVADASVYSDLHKDCYGYRPRYEVRFQSVEDFKKHFDFLVNEILPAKMAQDKEEQAKAAYALELDIEKVKETVAHCDRFNAIRILMDQDDLDIYNRQDIEHFEWARGLKFNSLSNEIKYD